jgi:hypothetical protein
VGQSAALGVTAAACVVDVVPVVGAVANVETGSAAGCDEATVPHPASSAHTPIPASILDRMLQCPSTRPR